MNTHITTATTMTINTFPLPIHTGAIKPDWVRAAQEKGFNIVARVVDRLHLALQCHRCGHIDKARLYTLMHAQPLCVNCLEQAWRAEAEAAGLVFVGRDLALRHYGVYRLPCGHEVRRQFALIKRVAAGEAGLRCDTCHAASEAAEAKAQGWEFVNRHAKLTPVLG